jgi:putative tryptophan/tyrosine transport system substrate-binding protein
MAARSAQRRNRTTDAVSDVAYWHEPDPTATSARISGSSSEARFRPYESARLRRTLLPVERGANMRRREFLGVLGSAAAAWPLAARAQQSMPVIGLLSSLAASDATRVMTAFRQGLNSTGYVEDSNVTIEYRWAAGQYEQLPALAADLVGRKVAVIAAISGTPAALAAKAATATIPVVFAIGNDPVAAGLVKSLNRPGGNVTGATFFTQPLATKRLELLRELMPSLKTIAVLVNPDNAPTVLEGANAQVAAQAFGWRSEILNASVESHIDDAFTVIVQKRIDALFVSSDALFFIHRDKLVALAARHAVPVIYADREQAEAGGLISYGASRSDAYRQAGTYVGQILKGESASSLPVVLPTKYALVINTKCARELGLSVPNSMQLLADELIE